jgi:diguanylate cyclase (GGDEF)-like protein/PAS domain S-box-containing protein
MNTLPLLHFLTFLIYTGMFFYLLKADLESRLNRVLAAFIGCFGLWSFSSIIIFQPNIAENTAILMDRIASLGWVSLNSFYLWFAFLFAEKKKVLKTNFIYFILLVPPLIFIYKIWTGFLVSGYSEQPWGWARIWSDSMWSYSFFLYLLSFSFVALYLIYDFGKKTKMPLKQKQVRVIFYTSLISLIIGIITDILLPLYSVDEFPPVANVVYLILVGGIVYSIVKYRFIRVTPYMAAEQIISTMADSLILLDKNGSITSVNEALLNLSGYEKEELLGKTIELFCNKSDMKQILADSIARKKAKKGIELNLKTKSGEQIPVIVSLSPVFEESGEIVGTVCLLTEITELEMAKEILRKSHEEALGLFQNSPLAGLYQNDHGVILDINRKFTELFGYTPEEVKGKNINEGMIFPEENTVSESEWLTRKPLDGEDVKFETVRKKKDGTLVPVLITVSDVVTKDDKKAIIAFYQDISIEKEYLERTEESEKKFRNVFYNMPAAYYQTDKDGNLLMINPTGIKLLGFQTLDDIIGKNIAQNFYYKPDDRTKFLEVLKDGGGQVEVYEIVLKNREGIPIPVSTNSHYYYDETGEIAGVEGLFIDMTERKLAEEALRKSHQEFASLFQSHSEAILYIDEEANIIDANKRFTELFGYTLEEIKGKNVDCGIIHPPDKIDEGKELDKRVRSQGYSQFETIRKKKDGIIFPVSISGSSVLIDGESKGYIITYIDITERKLAEEALRKSQQEFASLFQSLSEAILYLDERGIILEANKRFTELFGYTLEEIKGKDVNSGIIHPPDKIEEGKELDKRIFSQSYSGFETVRKKKDGTIFPVFTSGSPVLIDGKVKGIIAIYMDITERKLAEEALRKSQQEFSSLFQSNTEALAYLDERGNILDINRRFTELFGFKLEEIKGKNINYGVIVPPDKAYEGEELDKKTLSRDFSQFESIRKKKDGTLFPVSISSSSVFIDGKIGGIIATYIDITERKQAEEALRKSQKEFSSLFQSNTEALAYLDERGKILDINKRFTELFGYTLEEIKGKNANCGIIHPPDKIKEGIKLDKSVHSKGYSGFETVRKKKDGTLFPVSISSSAVHINGEVGGMISTFIDITERKKMEEQLQKMARSDALTGCFNRGYGLELLERQIRLAKRNNSPLLIAFLDINHLKQINDRFGHQEGDWVIKMVGNLLKSTLREVDIICRMGGDEFLLAFPDSSLKEAPLIRERLEEELFSLNKSINKDYQIRFSIGFSEYLPSESQTSDELIMIADQRMYEDKKKKR